MDSFNVVQLSVNGLALIPLVMALTSLVKLYVDARWAPLFALLFGVAGSFLIPMPMVTLTVVQGLMVGLSAAGVYSGVKTLTS